MSISYDQCLGVLLTLTLLIFFEVTDVQAQAGFLPQDEKDALRDIAKELGKTDWDFSLNPCDNNSNWNTPKLNLMPQYDNSLECNCSYPGGVCHVVSLFLKGQDLNGVLPPSLGKLPYFKMIDLTRNYLNGTIPPEWASTKLEYLSVSVNRLSGRIPPYLGNITSLIRVSLESNMFSGTVPAELGKLENLVTLSLSSNYLSGELPVELNKLTNLKDLRLSSNSFTGKIPSLESWKQLQILEIQASGMEGPIPESVSLLSNLQQLRISDLSGEGSHFPNLSSMKSMQFLMLRSCNLNGTIPAVYISQMSKLQFLDLTFNTLYGDIPDLQGLSYLEKMFLTGNSFNGNAPNWISDRKERFSVDLSYNHFSEESIPPFCDSSLNLFRSYDGGKNSDLAKCLSNNRCFKDYYSIYINCGGPVASIGNKYYEADQDPGGATKFFPATNSWGFSSTGVQWDTSKNAYTTTNVSTLAMDGSELYTSARLSPLSLTYYGRCLVNGNYTVTLHFAEIIFRDNQSYQSLGRRAFDVYIQGANIFKDFDIKNEAGGVDKAVIIPIQHVSVTNKTLEIRLQYTGKGTTVTPTRGVYGPLISAISIESEFNPPTHHKRSIFIVLGAVAAALCVILTVVGISWQRGYIGDRISREKELRGLDLQTGVFTYRQMRAATNNFSVSNKLGEGGFGSVYKGVLLDGTLIAVKRLSSRSRQGNREFVNEIGMITGIQHPNIVRLHGCCVERNHLLLVYEYMENNSLAHALFETNNWMDIDWPSRQRICVGIAKGLTFLHEESVLRMVHRDIKATNVLLDTDLTPKISDFGLAKLDDDENTHITTRVAGTLGYMAPEYALWGYLTYKADVYSFGILALEIVAGKKNNMTYKPSDDYYCLLDCAANMQQKGSLIDLVDPRLGAYFNKIEAVRIMKIALLCTNQSPALRPTMSQIVNMLEGRTKIMESDMNLITSEAEFKFRSFRGKVKEIHSHESAELDSFVLPSSSSSHAF